MSVIPMRENPSMGKDHDIVGKHFARLFVEERIVTRYAKKSRSMLRCKCDCGAVVLVEGTGLRAGRVVSCGCLRNERVKALARNRSPRKRTSRPRKVFAPISIPKRRTKTTHFNTTHGHAPSVGQSPTFRSWQSMKQRCLNPNSPNYRWYGGRGIRICERWVDSFENFLEDMGVRPLGTSLDRIDSDRGYEPGNVRWSDKDTQGRNRRGVKLTVDLVNEALGRMEHGETCRSVASRLGVSSAAIREILIGHNWRDVPNFTGSPTWKS